MPTQYKRKGTSCRAQWSEENLRQALTKVRNCEISFRQAQIDYHIPRRTLQRRLNTGNMRKGSLGPSGLFGINNEKKIVEYVIRLSNAGFIPTRAMLRAIAYRFAEELELPHKFNKNYETAGDAWLSLFLRRNPELKIFCRSGLTAEKIQGMKKQSITILTRILQENYLFDKPSHIFNMDECVLEVNYTVDTVITEEEHKHNVQTVGEKITVVACCNAAGKFLPPDFILGKCDEEQDLGEGLPPGSHIYANSKSACITTELFRKWFTDQFLKNKPPGKVVLILDEHLSHISSPALFYETIENDVIIIGLASSQQPLEHSLFDPFKNYFKKEVQARFTQNPQKNITRNEMGHLIGTAWSKAATTDIGISGFQSTDIYPLNRLNDQASNIPGNLSKNYLKSNKVSKNNNMLLLTSSSGTPLKCVVLKIANNVLPSETTKEIPENAEKRLTDNELTSVTTHAKNTEEYQSKNRKIKIESSFDDEVDVCGAEMNYMIKRDYVERMELAEPTEESNEDVNTTRTTKPIKDVVFFDDIEPRTFFKEEEDDTFFEYRDSDVSGSNSRHNEAEVLNSRPFQLGQDEYDAVGYNVASKLRHMDKNQRIIAERIIAETLFQGQMGTLTVNTTCSSFYPTLPSQNNIVEEMKFNADSSV